MSRFFVIIYLVIVEEVFVLDHLLAKISKIGMESNINKVILFGSRARGDNNEKSDYDIAFVSSNLTPRLKCTVIEKIDEIDTVHKIDVVFLSNLNGNDELTINIKRDGKILMSKFETKFNNFKNALQKLKDGISDYDKAKIETIRDGVIQRFEFTTELAWKSVREYLLTEGIIDINTPKTVMKEAFSAGIISNEQGWLQILNDRNATSHIYDEEEAVEIFDRIITQHINLFNELFVKLENAI